MSRLTSREIRLKSRPEGMPKPEDFEMAEVEVPEPGEGQVLVLNTFMSVDPYMRGRMMDVESYIPPFGLGEPLEGGAVGRVEASRNPKFTRGDHVLGMLGWREYYVSDGSGLLKIDPAAAPIQAYLGVLGMTGLTAYVGLLDMGRLKAGDTVFVSAASGAVGGVVCQIAKIKGCRVVGSVGSDEKAAWLLNEAGIDTTVNYKTADNLVEAVGRQCPEGIDVFFDGVGGAHLEAALEHMNPHGRIVLCGMISQYNATRRPRGPGNLAQIIVKRLTVQGFIVGEHFDRQRQFAADMANWIAEGRIRWKETVVEGIENAPSAFIGLFRGENFGKMLVKLA
ncbi:MAG: NADP-dependent oxidoreductase [Deltaproteobacteria bacterium]|nr:NADP-dependent oxidoreductase [Deltaproteobacteria bacterium]